MPDIQLRLGKDVLVLSAPVDALLARQGFDPARDRQYLNLMEPDAMADALGAEVMTGAACLVAPTEDITAARLAHMRMEGDAPRLAAAALKVANDLRPQHVLVEIGPCGLPLDASSKTSLNENRAQYAAAARAFSEGAFDAFLLSGFSDVPDLKCALMGLAQASEKPVFASVSVGGRTLPEPPRTAGSARDDERIIGQLQESMLEGGFEVMDAPAGPPLPAALRRGLDPADLPGAFAAMADLGAAVVGFETEDPADAAVEYARLAAETGLPVLAQLRVVPGAGDPRKRGLVPVEEVEGYTVDSIVYAAARLHAAGVQFVRATGAATPAFTGALAASLNGLDVRTPGQGD